MGNRTDPTTPLEGVGHVAGKDQLAKKLSLLAEKLAKSGLRLTDGSGKIKAMAFIGGVRKPIEKDRKDE